MLLLPPETPCVYMWAKAPLSASLEKVVLFSERTFFLVSYGVWVSDTKLNVTEIISES